LAQKKKKSSVKKSIKKTEPKVNKKSNVKTQTIPKVVAPKTIPTKTTKKPKQKKDIMIISALSVLLLIIIVLLIVVSPSERTPVINDNNETIDIPDVNDNYNDNDFEDIDMTEEEIYAQLEDIQQRVNTQIISEQKAIFEGWYEELGIDEKVMNQCIARNDYSSVDVNMDNSEVLEKIMEDISLARYGLGLQGTPGITVNGYKLDGFVEYDIFKKRIDAALLDLENEVPLIDYSLIEKTTYEYDSEKDPVLYVIYNEDHDFTRDEVTNIMNATKESDYNAFFNKLYDTTEIIEIHHLDAPQHILDLMAVHNINHIPFFFLEGDVSKIGFTEEELEMFEGIFYEFPEGGHFFQYKTTYLTDYKFLRSPADYKIGSDDANVTIFMFSDYDCGYCKKFEHEIVPKIIEDYVDKGLVNIVYKDFVIYEAQSLFPAVFARCAQQQGVYHETHLKLFNNTELFGGSVVNEIMLQYEDELNELQRHYEKLEQ
jgi:protein-disulfide isomerase